MNTHAYPQYSSEGQLGLRVQAACLGLGGAWLLIRTVLLESYALPDFAVQGGAFSCLAMLAIIARLRRRAANGAPESVAVYSRRDCARLVLAAILLISAWMCLLWWAVAEAHGLFLKRLQFGLDPYTKVGLGLWAAFFALCPKAPQMEHSAQGIRLRRMIPWLWTFLLIWTFPYTDPFKRYVQWSGLYLPIVASLAIAQVAVLIRREPFVSGWINCICRIFVPNDWMAPRSEADSASGIFGLRAPRLLMALLCIAAMAMHAINIEWGLPPNEDDREFRQIHPDERVTYEQAWRLYIDPGPVTFVWGGSAYFRLGMWVKEVATYFSDPDFTVRLQVVLLRCLNVAAVGGYVVLAFLCGRELFDNRTALLACLWMAIIPGNVVTALPARPESIFTFLCALSLYAGLRATRSSSSLQWLAIGSFVMGVAVATKMTGVCLIASLVAVVLQFRPTVGQFVGMLGLITIAGVFGYFVASFESFFFWEQWQAGIVLTRHLHSARQWPDIGHSVRSYLGPNAGFAWSVPGVVLLWLGAFLAVRRWRVVIILAFLLAGHLLLFLQRDVTLRSQVHLSIAVALIVAHAMVTVVDNCARRPWLRRIAVFAEVVLVLFVMQESLGHVAYLRWGKDARVQASEWIESNIPPDRLIGITPYYYGDWSAVPPLDERRRRVAVLPTSRAYDASGYKDRALDYVVLCNLSIENIDNSAEAMEFVRFVQAEHVYRRVQTFRSSFDTVRIAEWLGGKLPYDWEYTRPTLYLYERPGRTE